MKLANLKLDSKLPNFFTMKILYRSVLNEHTVLGNQSTCKKLLRTRMTSSVCGKVNYFSSLKITEVLSVCY